MRRPLDSFGSRVLEVSTPRFSLVLPCLSPPETLGTTLDGIAAQDFDLRAVQVIVIDDASDPPLAPTVSEFNDEANAEVVYLRNHVNQGRAAARNAGLAVARGEILVFMDVDQLLDPEFLSTMDRAFGANLDQSIRANTSVWDPLLPRSAFLRYYNSRFLGNRTADELSHIDLNDLPPKYYATTCMATGREAVLRVGGFDETFRRYGCEDEELGVRLSNAGVPLRLEMEARSYSTDDSLTVTRACKRLVDYAGFSVPHLLKKHPEYREQLALGFLEESAGTRSLPKRTVAWLLRGLYRPRFVIPLLRYLERKDSFPRFQPPHRLYQIAFLGFYLEGIRSRRKVNG
ncbi:hypothetical protein BH11ARM2_BH11ARM2_10640 [soil metagenome]